MQPFCHQKHLNISSFSLVINKRQIKVLMKSIIHIVTILFIFSLFSLCSREQPESVAPQLIKIEEGQKQLVLADNKLGYAIYKSLWSSENQNKNILVSPISLNKPLSIILFGTDNNYNVRRILHVQNQKKDLVFTKINQLNNTIFNIDEQSQFKTSTSFLTHRQNNLTEAFKKFIQQSKILKIDYVSSDNLVHETDNISGSSVINIENEISLKCSFKYQTSTTESPFYLNPNESKFVEMLVCESEFNFYSDKLIKAIEMPLGRGNYNALIILPESNQSLNNIKSKLSKNYLSRINKRYRKLSLSVKIPQLDIEYAYSLNKSLKEQGLSNLFSEENQEFKHLNTGKNLYLNNLSQSVKIETVSKPIRANTLFEGESRASFFVDHPFLLIITEKYSGSILFIGQITNPVH